MRYHYIFKNLCVISIFFLCGGISEAATLRVSPNTGVYSVGGTFTASVLLNTEGKSVNTADGVMSYNPKELQVISINKASSVFNLWVEEPTFSNGAGTISFSGGAIAGYTGPAGNVFNITFKPLGAGTPKVIFKSGSILARDGIGTNILTGMNGATYTVSAPTATPEPEYIAPPNTPKAPTVTSSTHEDGVWSKNTTATLTWVLPQDVVAVRMLLDESPATIPTKVYDERIGSKEISDLQQGVSYFHLQFKNGDGWGRVSHFKLAIDSEPPKDFLVSSATSTNDSVGIPVEFTFEDISPVTRYRVQIGGGAWEEFSDEKQTKHYLIDSVEPGEHTAVFEAYDSAGNMSVATYTFKIEAFEKPQFTEYPERLNEGVIPAIKGITRPGATVTIELRDAQGAMLSDTSAVYNVTSDDVGNFVFIPSTPLVQGVYTLTAIARDARGHISNRSDEIKIIVEKPGYLAVGSLMIEVLSVIIPLVALVLLLVATVWFMLYRFKRWRRSVQRETSDIDVSLKREFGLIIQNLDKNVEALTISRKGKLTKSESALIDEIRADITRAQEHIAKEIDDVEHIVT